jgi:hypothetical protein
MTSRTVDLGYEQLLLLEGRPGTRVKVIFGGVWLTEEGGAGDVFAHTGDEVAVRSRRLSILEGLGTTRLEVIEPAARRRFKALADRFGAVARLLGRAKSLVSAPAWSPRTPRGTLAVLAAVVGVAIPALVLVGISATAATLSRYL